MSKNNQPIKGKNNITNKKKIEPIKKKNRANKKKNRAKKKEV